MQTFDMPVVWVVERERDNAFEDTCCSPSSAAQERSFVDPLLDE